MSSCRALMVTAALAAAGCTPAIDYPPPPQKPVLEGTDNVPENRILSADHPGLNDRIVQDIVGREPAAWRWTGEHPRVRIRLETERWVFHAGFVVPGVVLKRMGPVTLTFVINDQIVGQQRYTTEGRHEFEAPVSSEVIGLADPVEFGFDVAPVLVAEEDGAKLGVLLERIGFRKGKR